MIYLVQAAQFERPISAFIIMLTVPLTTTGTLLTLFAIPFAYTLLTHDRKVIASAPKALAFNP